MPRQPAAVVALLAGLAMLVAACGDSNDDSGGGSAAKETATPAKAAGPTAKCGLGNGKKATGEPIKLGAIATKQPGTDFTDIPNMAKAYFDCVNDNGGINGRPVQYVDRDRADRPRQVASLAKKLIETEQGRRHRRQHEHHRVRGQPQVLRVSKGFYVIDSGIAPECYSTPNIAAVNMGPRYSVDGAAQYLIAPAASKKIVARPVQRAGHRLHRRAASADRQGRRASRSATLKENVPIQDANSVALKLVQAAGDGGGVVLNFTPPEALKILQAASAAGPPGPRQVGLLDAVQHRLPGRGARVGVERQAGRQRRAQPDDSRTARTASSTARCSRSTRRRSPLGSFSQMGFVDGAHRHQGAARRSRATYTAESVNEAFKNVKDFKTDILCKPWYYGDAPLHIPNNTDRTTTPKDGKMVQKEDCFPISDVDPAINAGPRRSRAKAGRRRR